jgi:hypothetical protein
MKQLEPKFKSGPFMMLAPDNAVVPPSFSVTICEPEAHSRIRSEMQVMRGAVALAEGAIGLEDLDANFRYQMPGDSNSWHLLRIGDNGRIRGCARILVHPPNVAFSRLRISSSAVAKSREWGRQVRSAVEQEIAQTGNSGITLVEPGGWVLDEELRGGPDAVSIALSAFAWSRLMGGCLAFVTATVKHGSSSMLRRLGASHLTYAGTQIPRYYDPAYRCEMELLKINTNSLNPRFEAAMARLTESLALSPVLSGGKLPSSKIGLAA